MPHNDPDTHDDKLFEELERAFDDIQSGKLEVPAFGTEDAEPLGLPAAAAADTPFPTASPDTTDDDIPQQTLEQLKLIRLKLEALPDDLRDVFGL